VLDLELDGAPDLAGARAVGGAVRGEVHVDTAVDLAAKLHQEVVHGVAALTCDRDMGQNTCTSGVWTPGRARCCSCDVTRPLTLPSLPTSRFLIGLYKTTYETKYCHHAQPNTVQLRNALVKRYQRRFTARVYVGRSLREAVQ